MKYLSLILFFALLATACSKKDTEGYTTQTIRYETVVAFWNRTDIDLNVDYYTNAEDYKYSKNALMRFKIAKGTQYADSFTTDKKSQTFFVDIYNDDKSYSNWAYWLPITQSGVFNKDSLVQAGFEHTWFQQNGSKKDYTIGVSTYLTTNWRNLFINGNAPETVWKAVGGQNWSTLTSDQKYYKLTIGKDMRCVYHRMQNGVVVNTDAWAYMQKSIQPTGGAKLTIEQYGAFRYLSTYNGDTLVLNTPQGDMYMVKE